MILTKEQKEEFEKAAESLIKFLGDNFHPHVTVIVRQGEAEFLEGSISIKNDSYIRD